MTNINPAKMSIAVLAGGTSSEREISLDSGHAVERALADAGFGRVEFVDAADKDALQQLSSGGFDCVFLALHGEGGEDGTIQGALEYLGLPYVGSGVAASACAADKDVSKVIYAHAGIPMAPGVALTAGEPYDLDEIVFVTGERCFVKPAVNGSSFGVTPVYERSGLAEAIEKAFELGDKVLVEKWIVGTEITVGVLGNDDPVALPIVEINPGDGAEFYDLKVKYEPAEMHHIIPARLSEEDYLASQRYAVLAHKALGCSGLSRTDFIVSAEDGPIVLETNTLPGMTETSLLPDEARHVGIEFPQLCTRLVELALERSERRRGGRN